MPNGHYYPTADETRASTRREDEENRSWEKLVNDIPTCFIAPGRRMVAIPSNLFPVHYHIADANGYVYLGKEIYLGQYGKIVCTFNSEEFRVGNRFDNILISSKSLLEDERSFLTNVGIYTRLEKIFGSSEKAVSELRCAYCGQLATSGATECSKCGGRLEVIDH